MKLAQLFSPQLFLPITFNAKLVTYTLALLQHCFGIKLQEVDCKICSQKIKYASDSVSALIRHVSLHLQNQRAVWSIKCKRNKKSHRNNSVARTKTGQSHGCDRDFSMPLCAINTSDQS